MRGGARTAKELAPIQKVSQLVTRTLTVSRLAGGEMLRAVPRSMAIAPAVPRVESSPKFTLQEEAYFMDTTSKTALVIAIVVAALLLLLFGGGMATGTMFSGGMMGSGSMGGISWMWLPTLLIVVLGVALFSAISGKK